MDLVSVLGRDTITSSKNLPFFSDSILTVLVLILDVWDYWKEKTVKSPSVVELHDIRRNYQ